MMLENVFNNSISKSVFFYVWQNMLS